MKLQLTITILFLLFINNIKARWYPNQYMSWNIALGSEVDISKEKAEIIEIDLEKDAKLIEKYHQLNKRVICYFSGGTIEEYRDDYKNYAAVSGLVKNRYEAWPDERWLDYRVSGIKPLIEARMELAVKKKCDAIDVDNVDGYQIKDVKNWSDPLTKEDAITFTKWLGEKAHYYGLSIGLKNCLDIVDTVGKYYDFAVNEGCARRDECNYYKNFLDTGKPVLGITYNGLSDNIKALCKNLNGLPITMIIKESTKLVQDSVVFDGKKYCGSEFVTGRKDLSSSNTSSGSSSSSSSSGSSGSNSSSSSSGSSGSSSSSSSSGSSGSNTSSSSSGSSGSNSSNSSSGSSSGSNSSNSSPGSSSGSNSSNSSPGSSSSSNTSNSTGTSNSSSSKTITSSNPTSQSIIDNNSKESNNTILISNYSGNLELPIVNGNITLEDTTSNLNSDKNENNDTKSNNKEIKNNIETEDNERGHTGLVAGVAVTGSVVGAAALIVFKKKNPRQYEQLKDNLSKGANTVKRSASSMTRKLTTKKRKTKGIVGNPNIDFDYDLNNNPYSTYRYTFIKSLNY